MTRKSAEGADKTDARTSQREGAATRKAEKTADLSQKQRRACLCLCVLSSFHVQTECIGLE